MNQIASSSNDFVMLASFERSRFISLDKSFAIANVDEFDSPLSLILRCVPYVSFMST